jgi:hypothetical protein
MRAVGVAVAALAADPYPLEGFHRGRYHGVRVAEDDPDSDLYAESSDADAVIGYIVAHA